LRPGHGRCRKAASSHATTADEREERQRRRCGRHTGPRRTDRAGRRAHDGRGQRRLRSAATPIERGAEIAPEVVHVLRARRRAAAAARRSLPRVRIRSCRRADRVRLADAGSACPWSRGSRRGVTQANGGHDGWPPRRAPPATSNEEPPRPGPRQLHAVGLRVEHPAPPRMEASSPARTRARVPVPLAHTRTGSVGRLRCRAG